MSERYEYMIPHTEELGEWGAPNDQLNFRWPEWDTKFPKDTSLKLDQISFDAMLGIRNIEIKLVSTNINSNIINLVTSPKITVEGLKDADIKTEHTLALKRIKRAAVLVSGGGNLIWGLQLLEEGGNPVVNFEWKKADAYTEWSYLDIPEDKEIIGFYGCNKG